MYRTLIALIALAAGTAAVRADVVEDARIARDLAISSLERLDAIAEPASGPIALAEQLRLEVHVPLLSYYAAFDRYENYDRADMLRFQSCFIVMTVEVDRFSNEVEYALKVGKPLPEMVNRQAYETAREACNTALKAASRP